MLESKIFAKNISQSSQSKLDGIWNIVRTCWFDEPHTHVISIQYSREIVISIEELSHWLVFETFTDSFQTWYDDRDH